jgi:hypothetical protein
MVQSPSVVWDNRIMKRTVHPTKRETTERAALRGRVKRFYFWFNKGDWDHCYALIDPQLTQEDKVELKVYSELMQTFKGAYGAVKPWVIRLSLHLNATPNQRDRRPFAYVYVVWQDDAHGFHMFRERWIKDHGKWFTRVVGLIPNRDGTDSSRD